MNYEILVAKVGLKRIGLPNTWMTFLEMMLPYIEDLNYLLFFAFNCLVKCRLYFFY